MRVLLMIRQLAAGGAERQLILLARTLKRRGHDVRVAVLRAGGALAPELEQAGIIPQQLNRRGRLDVLGTVRDLRRLVLQSRTEVLYSFLPGDNIASAVLKLFMRKRLRVVWGAHDAAHDYAAAGAFARLVYRIEPLLSRIPDAVLAVSPAASRAAVRRGSSPRNVVVVPNAIDVDTYRPDPAAGAALRRGLGVGAGPLIGIVGRIVPIKDHPLFLQAAAVLHSRRPDARFAVVGDGPEEWVAQLRALERRLGLTEAVFWLGRLDDLRAVYTALDILTLCSHSEGFGNVVGEAMACGTPCVSLNVGAAADLIGDTGCVVEERTADALASAWESVIQRITPDLRREARHRITSRFAADVVAPAIEEVLRPR